MFFKAQFYEVTAKSDHNPAKISEKYDRFSNKLQILCYIDKYKIKKKLSNSILVLGNDKNKYLFYYIYTSLKYYYCLLNVKKKN